VGSLANPYHPNPDFSTDHVFNPQRYRALSFQFFYITDAEYVGYAEYGEYVRYVEYVGYV
jgi:hypothetical protein